MNSLPCKEHVHDVFVFFKMLIYTSLKSLHFLGGGEGGDKELVYTVGNPAKISQTLLREKMSWDFQFTYQLRSEFLIRKGRYSEQCRRNINFICPNYIYQRMFW